VWMSVTGQSWPPSERQSQSRKALIAHLFESLVCVKPGKRFGSNATLDWTRSVEFGLDPSVSGRVRVTIWRTDRQKVSEKHREGRRKGRIDRQEKRVKFNQTSQL
jgi:hypothetical protein